MEKLASIEQSFTCHMLANSFEAEKIFKQLEKTQQLAAVYEQFKNIEQMFEHLQAVVPQYELEEGQKLRIQNRMNGVNTLQFGNVLHIPFVQQQPPMYIVLERANEEQLQQERLEILALIELCAIERKDCIIIAGNQQPIIFEKGILRYDSFSRFMALLEVSHLCSFDTFVKKSIAAPFVQGSDVVLVDFNEQPLQLQQSDIDHLVALKTVFQSSIKALVTNEVKDQQLIALLDEVYIHTV